MKVSGLSDIWIASGILGPNFTDPTYDCWYFIQLSNESTYTDVPCHVESVDTIADPKFLHRLLVALQWPFS